MHPSPRGGEIYPLSVCSDLAGMIKYIQHWCFFSKFFFQNNTNLAYSSYNTASCSTVSESVNQPVKNVTGIWRSYSYLTSRRKKVMSLGGTSVRQEAPIYFIIPANAWGYYCQHRIMRGYETVPDYNLIVFSGTAAYSMQADCWLWSCCMLSQGEHTLQYIDRYGQCRRSNSPNLHAFGEYINNINKGSQSYPVLRQYLVAVSV